MKKQKNTCERGAISTAVPCTPSHMLPGPGTTAAGSTIGRVVSETRAHPESDSEPEPESCSSTGALALAPEHSLPPSLSLSQYHSNCVEPVACVLGSAERSLDAATEARADPAPAPIVL